jgi:DNA-binding LytR/AlgR family response regulator
MNRRITIHTENSIYVLDPEEVMYCQCEAASTTIHLVNGEALEISKPMDDLEEVFEGSGCIRPNPRFLVNRNYILRVDMAGGYMLVLTSGLKIPIEKQRQDEILKFIRIIN